MLNPALLIVCALSGQVDGPDVYVGDLDDLSAWGSRHRVAAYSVGTISCNQGDAPVEWEEDTNRHPVIAQNLYRLRNGRFEQIGMSWVKHGFCALSFGHCFSDCRPTDCDTLGVHCSDPYSAELNGQQFNLGPRGPVNASTGEFPYPFDAPFYETFIHRRLQVRHRDLDPLRNPAARYFVEGHYIAPDDAEWNNDDNNASFRPVKVTPFDDTYQLEFIEGETVRAQRPAIDAWGEADPSVAYRLIDVPDDGRFILAFKVAQTGDRTWLYEYALYNMNSHRSAGSFTVPIPPGVRVGRIGFHDVDHHSGDGENGQPYSNEDWQILLEPDRVTWTTDTYDRNVNAHALRWGTLYNFRLRISRPPQPGVVIVGLFRPGQPGELPVEAEVPSPP